MNKKLLCLALWLVPFLSRGALTDGLAAYWDFEGNAANHPGASGGSAFNGTPMGDAGTTGPPVPVPALCRLMALATIWM